MADVKKLQTRIALKYDTYANWTNSEVEGQGANLVLLRGEIGICEIPSGNNTATTAPTVLFKVGDGTTPFSGLKWASALAADVYGWAKASDVQVEGKSIKFIGGAVDSEGNKVDVVRTFNFATPEEVAAAVKVVADDLDGLEARVAAVEGNFTGEGSVQSQIDGLGTRLTAVEGAIEAINDEETGILVTAKAYAKDYTDGREVEIKKYVDQAELDAVSSANGYTDGKVATINANLESIGTDITNLQNADVEIKGRLDVIEGEGEGSVKKALADAKSYADGLAGNYDEAGAADAVKSYVDGLFVTQDARDDSQDSVIAENKAAIEKEVSDRETAISGVVSGYEAADLAINNKIGSVTEGKTVVGMIGEAQTAAEGNAKNYVDGLFVAQDTRDDGQDSLIAANTQAITDEVAARELLAGRVKTLEDVDNATQAELDAYKEVVTGAIATAKSEAIADAKTETEKQVKALADGAVATNASEIARVEGLVTAEVERATGVEEDFESRIATMEVFFQEEKVEGALNTLFEIQNYVDTHDGAVETMVGNINANATAIEGLSDRMDTAEDAIDAVEADLAGYKETVTNALAGKQDVIPENTYDVYGSAAAVRTYVDGDFKTAVESYADGKASAAQTAAEGYADGIVAGLKSTLEAKDAELVTEDERLAGLIAGNTTTIGNVSERAELGITNAAAAQSAADKAQGEVDALEGVVSTLRSEYDVTKALATANEAAIAALDTRVGTVEGKVSTLETESAKYALKSDVETELAKKVNVSDYETYQGTVTEALNNRYTKNEVDGKFETLNGVVSGEQAKLEDLTTRVGTAEGNINTLIGIVQNGDNSNANLRSAITDLQTLTSGENGNAKLREDLTAVSGSLNALAGIVNNETTGLAATKAIADQNKTDIAGLDSRVEAIESREENYLEFSDIFIFNCGSSSEVIHKEVVSE